MDHSETTTVLRIVVKFRLERKFCLLKNMMSHLRSSICHCFSPTITPYCLPENDRLYSQGKSPKKYVYTFPRWFIVPPLLMLSIIKGIYSEDLLNTLSVGYPKNNVISGKTLSVYK